MRTIPCTQRTPEWYAARAGKVTSSAIDSVLAHGRKGTASITRSNYIAQIVAEILTGIPYTNGYCSPVMLVAQEQEPFARAAYELHRGVMVDTVGFVCHPTIDRAGASPDGLIEPDGLVEIKCPNTATHLNYLLANVVPTEYQPQMLWQMECAERDWCDFVSFDPRLPEHLQLFIKRLPRDEARIQEMTKEVLRFLSDVDEILERLPKAPDPLEITDADLSAVFGQ